MPLGKLAPETQCLPQVSLYLACHEAVGLISPEDARCAAKYLGLELGMLRQFVETWVMFLKPTLQSVPVSLDHVYIVVSSMYTQALCLGWRPKVELRHGRRVMNLTAPSDGLAREPL